MTSIRAELRGRTPVHDMLSVWAGPDAEHRAHCGDLYMRTEEATELIARIDAREVAACPVASEPVELPAELARELANLDPGDTIEDSGDGVGEWTVVANEYIDKARWESIHLLVIRNEAGQHFEDTYRRGLTEQQDTWPYESQRTATFTPVVPHTKVVTEWKAAPKGGQS